VRYCAMPSSPFQPKTLEREDSGLLAAKQRRLTASARSPAGQAEPLAVIPEPILISSADGRVSDFNAAAGVLFGGTVGIYGRPIRDLLPFIPAPRDGAGHERTWRGQIVDDTGHTLDLEVSQTSLVNGLLATCHIYVVHDISKREEANRSAEQLLYSTAHELSGPLTTLRSALDTLGSGFVELAVSDFERLLQGARHSTTRLTILVEDWLNAGNIRSGRLRVHPRPTRLSTIIDEAVATVQPILEAREQCLVRDIPEGHRDLEVLADGRYLRQVLLNLLDNAAKYSPEGEVIRIRATKVDSDVQITVEDHGPGIPDEERTAVFEWFYRSVPNHPAPGAGLGLAIVRAIIVAHGGTIGIREETGTGTIVSVSLPAAEGSRPG
jgi:signal transduction histidine kinase